MDAHASMDLFIPIIMLAAAVLVTSGVQRLHASPILGYLLAGLLIGPFGFGFIQNTPTTTFLADLGVVFLLFAIGLELPLERLRVMRHLVFGFGGITAVILLAAFSAMVYAWRGDLATALIVGGALTFSSTALLVQLLSERGEFSTRYGRAGFAAALFQDLSVAPMLVVIPLLNHPASDIAGSLVAAVLKAVLALIVIMYLGQLVLRPFYRIVIGNRNHELFTAMTLLVVFSLSFSTYHFGLSMALGALLAGVLLSETEFRHQIAADIEPFRGLFLGLFFMTVGMMIDLRLIADNFVMVLSLTALIMIVKLAVFFPAARYFGLPRAKALKSAILLAQGGEFAFILFGLAEYQNMIGRDIADIFSAAVVLSMAVTPVLVRLTWPSLSGDAAPIAGVPEADEFKDRKNHIVIAGFGRVGEVIADMLHEQGIAHIVIDDDADRVRRARADGLPVFYGDATKPHVLRSIGIERAKAFVVAVSSAAQATRIVEAIRHNWPDLPVFGRARDLEHARALREAGVTATVPITLQASLELGGTLLQNLGYDQASIDRLANGIRAKEGLI